MNEWDSFTLQHFTVLDYAFDGIITVLDFTISAPCFDINALYIIAEFKQRLTFLVWSEVIVVARMRFKIHEELSRSSIF